MSDFLLIWVAPPLVGAAIGLFTNWLAIKMLFQPLKEIRLLGIRVPFTPGILPRERYRISKSIGDTVARELLTEEVLRKRLDDPAVREALLESVSGFMTRLLDTPASSVLAKPEDGGDDGSSIATAVGQAFRNLASRTEFTEALASGMCTLIEKAGELPLDALVGPDDVRSMVDFIVYSSNGEFGGKLISQILRLTYGGAEGNRSVEARQTIPRAAFTPLVRVLAEGLYRASVPVIESFMNEPSTLRQFEAQALVIVRKAVGRLNPLQRIVVTAANYERTVQEALPSTMEDLSKSISEILRKEDMPAKVAGRAVAYLDKAEGKSGSNPAPLVEREAARMALESSLGALREHGAEIADRVMLFYEGRKDTSLSVLVGDLGLPVESVSRHLAVVISSALSSPGGGDGIARAVLSSFRSELAARFGEVGLGAILGMDTESKIHLSSVIADKLHAILLAETGAIVSGLDIRKIVVDRIDELDMKHVERMILDVVSRELTWITLIGGVLGGAIGIIQSLFYLFSK